MHYVYLLKLNNNKYYVGSSGNLKQRIDEHTRGKVSTTVDRKPKLIWYSAFTSKDKAVSFEKYLKTGSGFAFRNKRFL